jgi:hypothetical protein
MKNDLRKSTLKGLTADCVRRKIKIIKTVYSHELNKITRSKKSDAGTNDLYKPKLAAGDFYGGQLLHNCGHTKCTELIPFPNPVSYANRSLSSTFSNKVDISLNRKETATRTPARITSVDAILFYNGIQ